MHFLKKLTELQPELLTRVETTVKIHNSLAERHRIERRVKRLPPSVI